METIGKKAIKGMPQFKTSQVDIDKRCGNCACANEKKRLVSTS